MGAPRPRHLIKSRRRVEDDGEEEEGSVAAGVEEDSMSEGSAISDGDDDADAEGSDGDDADSSIQENRKGEPVANGHRETREDSAPPKNTSPTRPSHAVEMNDTEAMMNGLKVSGVEDEGVAFENMGEPEVHLPQGISGDQAEAPATHTIGDRRRREHEEYKKKRDADPAFVPNRGGFFMHDHRSAAPGQNGFRPFGRGRGRGRGAVGGPFPSSRYASKVLSSTSAAADCSLASSQPSGPADAPWTHDLHEVHEVVAQPDAQTNAEQGLPSALQSNNSASAPDKEQPPNRSFSRSTRTGHVQIRILLRGMSDPIVFSAVPVHQHTRLPHHRPPLRRDKPVRISMPDMPIRYIFPSTERSFIFIPRALRPNQQGFGRIRGRASFGGGYSTLGGFSSRRTSAYAGSAYSPSVALSRRSSLAREGAGEVAVSPGGIIVQRMAPVVRLPPAVEQMQPSNQRSLAGATIPPAVNLPQPSSYPLPQKPTFRENRPTALPMQHPKPQRTLQVADIDSPATLEFNPPQQQQQLPFHQQVPSQIAGQAYPTEYPHSRHPSHPSQASGGTPLPQVPDTAAHPQPFQSYPYQHPPNFYPQQFAPPIYYYPPPSQGTGAPSAAAPAFIPGQQYHYQIPVAPVPQPQTQTEPATQGGTVAQEINGMVYYLDPSQVAAGTENAVTYPSPAYSVPPPGGIVGMGGMMTPPIYYPPPPAFYPQQQG